MKYGCLHCGQDSRHYSGIKFKDYFTGDRVVICTNCGEHNPVNIFKAIAYIIKKDYK